MPTILGPPRSLTEREPYPQILKEDWHVMNRFLDSYAHLFKQAYYNVRVGGPQPGESHPNPKWDEVWRMIKQYRIDVILVADKEIWICEVTTHAGPRAIGQVLVYYTGYMQDPILGKNAHKVLIYETAADLIPETAKLVGIRTIQN